MVQPRVKGNLHLASGNPAFIPLTSEWFALRFALGVWDGVTGFGLRGWLRFGQVDTPMDKSEESEWILGLLKRRRVGVAAPPYISQWNET